MKFKKDKINRSYAFYASNGTWRSEKLVLAPLGRSNNNIFA